MVEEGTSDLVWRVGMLPFVYTSLRVPTNGCDLPDLLPFVLTFDKRTGSFLQMANEAVSSALAKAYTKGSMISGMMEEGGIGREYAEDFLRFLRESLGRERFDGTNVLEIGCGTGYLLHRLKLLGANVLGLEPGAHGQQGSKRFGIPIIRDFFPSKEVREKFDLIILYALLEHMQRPQDFLANVAARLEETGNIVISVPDSEPCIRVGDISMLMHEHWNYYTDVTLRNTIRMSTGSDAAIEKSRFGGAIYATTRKRSLIPAGESGVERDAQRLTDYMSLSEKGLDKLYDYLEEANARRESVGISVPARAINALSILKHRVDLSRLRFFDDNPRLHDKYFPGFNIPIEPTENLIKRPTDRVLVMSHTFGPRITAKLNSLTGKGLSIATWEDLFMSHD